MSTSLDVLAILLACGYDRVQIVNQALNWNMTPPDPAREGKHVSVRFDGFMSGLFGRELDPNRWLSFSEAASNFLAFVNLHSDGQLAHGWLDFHVTSAGHLDG